MQALLTKLRALSEHPRYGWLLQFIKFSIVGVSNTLINLGAYYLCLYVFKLHYQLCNLIAFVVSVTNAYYWNSRYVFADGERHSFARRALMYIKTVAGYGGTYLLSIFLLMLWVESLHISKAVAPLINLIITIPLNYIINKFWTFGVNAKKQ